MGNRREQKIRILETLEKHGWRRVSSDRSCDWWADEIWKLASDRPPTGARAWMAFLVDPEHRGARSAGEGVSAVAVNAVRLKVPTGWQFEMPFGRRWERGLDELLGALAAIRSSGAEPAPPE